ncbi:25S rRNA (adenine645-N1)-methyltransferase [Serendipita sp. 398]|nr:25S rRNA (adenine645-N1)-methyltransferase [Serendipita sp. 398]
MFEVSDWNTPSVPVVSSNSGSRKRKRATAANEDKKVQEATMNLEKLVMGLDKYVPKKQKPGNQGDHISNKIAAISSTATNSTSTRKNKGKEVKQSKNGTPRQTNSSSKVHTKDNKYRTKQRKEPSAEPRAESSNSSNSKPKESVGLTQLQNSMKNSLEGARFRYINEILYKSTSDDAVRLAKADPTMIDDYHTGFRHQVKSWPSNPVDQYITELGRLPLPLVVADLGCGDAAIARELGPRGVCVLSFDLKSDGKYIIEADICQRLPLPGPEQLEGETGAVVDVVICALSLMSTNWLGCIREAWRVLKSGGQLKVSEVTSRFKEVSDFVELVTLVGFNLKLKDESNTHFIKLEFLRKADTTPKEFREGVHQISLVLGVEASRDLETATFEGETPVAHFTGTMIKPRVGLTPILRAGLGMTDAMLTLFPDAYVYYLGLFREKVSLQPVEYYSKLPSSPTVDMVYLLDPLVATGGTAIAAINMLTDWGLTVDNIRLLSVLGSQEGIDHVRTEFPQLQVFWHTFIILEAHIQQIFVAAIDSELTDKGYLTPGLGDAVRQTQFFSFRI